MFTADARYINAYELETGRRVLQFDVLGEDERDLNLKLSLKLSLPHLSYTLTATQDRLFARLGAQSVGPRRSGEIPSYLVCLNLQPALGRLKRWLMKAPEGVQAVFEGTPVVLGNEEYHVEFVLDVPSGKLQAYILDGELENFIRIQQPSFQVAAKLPDRQELLAFAAVANRATGETTGDTSLFEARADWLKSMA